ncbi:MAG: thiamine pyrophosphate-dependent dehydrogenase E1 component subunit alpha [Luteolibacter sp.]
MTPESKIDILRTMWRIRRFEQHAARRYAEGEMGGWLLLDIGQESIAATVRAAMLPDDHSISGPRGFGHAIAAGLPMSSIMAELMGLTSGCSKGKGGMFSLFAPDKNHWGCHGIAAAQTPLAAGLAFALKKNSTHAASVCFMGEGAMNQGVFHETLNLASLFNLPVVFVIENNGFAMGTSEERSSKSPPHLAQRAEAYNMDWDHCADTDIPLIYEKATTALNRARTHQRPALLEISTMRYYGFTVADASHKKYRTQESIDHKRDHFDPLTLWSQQLISEGLISITQAEEMADQAKAEAIQSRLLAKTSPPPSVPQIQEDVYWETDQNTPASQIGHHFFQ